MCRVARKLGFTEEARIRRARKVAGEHYDRMIYGILREEWEQVPWHGASALGEP